MEFPAMNLYIPLDVSEDTITQQLLQVTTSFSPSLTTSSHQCIQCWLKIAPIRYCFDIISIIISVAKHQEMS